MRTEEEEEKFALIICSLKFLDSIQPGQKKRVRVLDK